MKEFYQNEMEDDIKEEMDSSFNSTDDNKLLK